MTAVLGRELMRRQIIDVIHGKYLGAVHDLFYDAYLATVLAVSLGYGAGGTHGIIQCDDIVMLGKDAVLVKHSNVAIVADCVPDEWNSRHQLLDTEVRTLEGIRLGTLDDVICDSHTLALSSLLVRLDPTLIHAPPVAELPVSAIRALSFDRRLVVNANIEEDRLIAL